MGGTKVLGWIMLVLAVLLFGVGIIMSVFAEYNYDKYFASYWSLADKSSTLEAKSLYIGQFVDKLNSSRQGFADYDAVFLKTPDNSFDKNFQALVSLRDRLNTISQMNESDFAYQTAIQQITSQEQGEATAMLNVFHGCYFLQSYPLLWDWYMYIVLGVLGLLGLVGWFMTQLGD
jgi:hypothetical protein